MKGESFDLRRKEEGMCIEEKWVVCVKGRTNKDEMEFPRTERAMKMIANGAMQWVTKLPFIKI